MRKYHISWEMIDRFAFCILHRYTNHKFTGVYGPPRGGCIPAVMVSHKLKIPMLAAPADGCLIVDDICDTGSAMQKYDSIKKERNYTIATICYKPQSTVEPDFYMITVENDIWVVFPWEFDS